MPPLIKCIKDTKESIFNFDHLRFALSQPPERFCPETCNIKRNTCPQSVPCLATQQANILLDSCKGQAAVSLYPKNQRLDFSLNEWRIIIHPFFMGWHTAQLNCFLIIFQTNYRLSWWICMHDHLSQACICNHKTILFI